MPRILSLLGLPFAILSTQALGQTCLDFESLTPGATYLNGATLNENGVQMTVSTLASGGFARILVVPPGSGNNVLHMNNAEVCFDLVCGEDISFTFDNSGGSVTLSINGDSTTLPTFSGSFSLGGATVSVSGNTVSISGTTVGTLCIGGQELSIDDLCFTSCDNGSECLEFEVLGGNSLQTGDPYVEGSFMATVVKFNGIDGSVKPSTSNTAGGTGEEASLDSAGLYLSNICARTITFHFGQGDRGIELTINGEVVLADDFADLDGTTIGGTNISVTAGDVGGFLTGSVTITGVVDSIIIGGQDLYLDDLCLEDCLVNCIDFEEEPVGQKFSKEIPFTEDGYQFEFTDYNSGDGTGTIDDQNRAGHLGQDLFLNGAVMYSQFNCMEAFSVHFGQYSDDVIIRLNGDSAEVQSMEDLDGTTVGGVELSVSFSTVAGGTQGVLTGEGDFDSFLIGGSRLYIDHLCLTPCPDPDCFGFDYIPLEKIHVPGDLLIEEQTTLEVFAFGSGSPSEAIIASGTQAGGVGNELRLTNAGVEVSYPCASSVTFKYAIDSTPVGLSVNGSSLSTVANFQALDGSTIGGVSVSVSGTTNGTVSFSGLILTVAIAGTDIRIDSICRTPCPSGQNCIDFEGINPGDSWNVFQGFSEDGVDIDSFYLFDLIGNLVSVDPFMATATNQWAGYFGQDIRLIDATASFDFGDNCVNGLTLHFGNYGGLVNIQINGDLQFFSDMAAMDGVTVGGALLSVTRVSVPGGYTGVLQVSGDVNSDFYLGGALFYIDHVCFNNCEPLDIEALRMTQVEDISGSTREYTMRVRLNGPGNVRLRGNTGLGTSWPIQNSAVVVPLDPNHWEITIQKPITQPRWFFRAEGY